MFTYLNTKGPAEHKQNSDKAETVHVGKWFHYPSEGISIGKITFNRLKNYKCAMEINKYTKYMYM